MIDYKAEILKFYYEKREINREKGDQYFKNKNEFYYDQMHEAIIEVNTVKQLMQRLGFTYEEVTNYVDVQDAKRKELQVENIS